MIIFPILYNIVMVFLAIYWTSFIATFIVLCKLDLTRSKKELFNITINITGIRNFNPYKLFKQLVLLYQLMTDRVLLEMYREKYAEDIAEEDTPKVGFAIVKPGDTTTEVRSVEVSDVNVLIRNIRDEISKTMINPNGAMMYVLLPEKLTVKHNLLPLTPEQCQVVAEIIDRNVENSSISEMGFGARNLLVIAMINTKQQVIYNTIKEYMDDLASIDMCKPLN